MLKFNDPEIFSKHPLLAQQYFFSPRLHSPLCVLALTVRCPASDKLLVTYALLKFKSVSFIARLRLLSNVLLIPMVTHMVPLFDRRLIRGKTLLFVNDIERCYKLKLFLEQFSIRSCVLNSELPLNSR